MLSDRILPGNAPAERSTLLTPTSARTAALPEQTIFPISVYPVSGKKTGLQKAVPESIIFAPVVKKGAIFYALWISLIA